jgi:hypothetical protein
VSSEPPPRDLIATLERDARLPDGPGERFTGYGVMGLPFRSGHALALRRWPASSVGPGYSSVWHRGPDGRWRFWSTAAPELSCTRYTGDISDDTRVSAIELAWPEPYRLTINSDEPNLAWEVDVEPTRRTRMLGALSRGLPGRMRSNEAVLRAMGPIAGWLLGVGRLALTGLMPNGQAYRAVPSYVWSVTASRARLDGVDLGTPAPLHRQATVGDFRIPQRGLLAIGSVDFDPLDEARHSTRVVRGG